MRRFGALSADKKLMRLVGEEFRLFRMIEYPKQRDIRLLDLDTFIAEVGRLGTA